jgi:hypothetical protein
MRIEYTQTPVIGGKTRAAAAPKACGSAPTTAASDVVALSYHLQLSMIEAPSGGREAAIDSLTRAYEAGAIRPDAARVANRLMNWVAPSGE